MISILSLEISKIKNLDIQGFGSLNICVFGYLNIWKAENLAIGKFKDLHAPNNDCKFKIKSRVVVYDCLIR